MNKKDFYENNAIVEIEWWLSWYCEYPHLYWARVRVFANEKADVAFQDENKTYGFNNKEFAGYFVSEDEFSLFQNLDDEDRKGLEMPPDVEIELPTWAENDFSGFTFIGDY